MGRIRRAGRRLAPFFRGSRLALFVLVGVAVLAGVVEAGLLAIIATSAAGRATGSEEIVQSVGPATLAITRWTAFGIALGMALLRAGLQVWLAWLPAQMSARVLADLRRKLFASFTATRWSVKAAERDGRSEERRVGKESRGRRALEPSKRTKGDEL